jgi:hypothetical protein
MIRVEIIANHSVEENILEAFSQEGVGKFYTKYPNVFGIGSSGPRMGDAVWPEENLALVVWCEEEEARGIARAVEEVKKQFPDEGIRVFGLPGQQNRFPQAAFYPSPELEQEAVFAPPSSPEPPPAAPEPRYSALQAVRPPPGPISPSPAHIPPVYSSPAPPVYTAPPSPSPGIDAEYDGQNMED